MMNVGKEHYRDRTSEEDEDQHDSHDTLLGRNRRTTRRGWTTTNIVLLVETCTLLIICIAFVIYLTNREHSQYQTTFPTDYGDLGKTIPFKQQTYSNPIQPNAENTKLEIWWDESMPRYAGKPEAQIDLNWDKLLTNAGFNLSTSDPAATFARGQTHEFTEDGKIFVGLEVFHALHCLDIVRTLLYPDVYIHKDGPEMMEMHKAHCVDYLRQYIQCNADLTPMWSFKPPEHDTFLVKPYVVHTCRDFDALQRWIDERKV